MTSSNSLGGTGSKITRLYRFQNPITVSLRKLKRVDFYFLMCKSIGEQKSENITKPGCRGRDPRLLAGPFVPDYGWK